MKKDDVTLIRYNIDKVLSEIQDLKKLKMIYEFIRGIKGN